MKINSGSGHAFTTLPVRIFARLLDLSEKTYSRLWLQVPACGDALYLEGESFIVRRLQWSDEAIDLYVTEATMADVAERLRIQHDLGRKPLRPNATFGTSLREEDWFRWFRESVARFASEIATPSQEKLVQFVYDNLRLRGWEGERAEIEKALAELGRIR